MSIDCSLSANSIPLMACGGSCRGHVPSTECCISVVAKSKSSSSFDIYSNGDSLESLPGIDSSFCNIFQMIFQMMDGCRSTMIFFSFDLKVVKPVVGSVTFVGAFTYYGLYYKSIIRYVGIHH